MDAIFEPEITVRKSVAKAACVGGGNLFADASFIGGGVVRREGIVSFRHLNGGRKNRVGGLNLGRKPAVHTGKHFW